MCFNGSQPGGLNKLPRDTKNHLKLFKVNQNKHAKTTKNVFS